MNEEWRWIKGYDGLYQISNFGRLKSFRNKKENGKILSNIDKRGWYFTVNLFDETRKMSTQRIHRLVVEAFIGEIPKGYHVHHKDGNKQNNRVDNLEIIHPKDHAAKTIAENPNVIAGMNYYNRYVRPKRIKQYALTGHCMGEYENSIIASKFTGVCWRNILQVANKTPYGKNNRIRKQAGGYVWVFSDTEDK